MSWSHGERLYELLPAVHRSRDAAQGEPLRALLSVIESEVEALEGNIEDLHEDWFIETCADWVIPYLGDLLGARLLHQVKGTAAHNLRSFVANTLRYRRRKGTATVLEQLALDTTGWRSRAVEFFPLLGWTQHYNHIRPEANRTPDLRRTEVLERLGTAFDGIGHTVDVRRVKSGRGYHNLPNVGLFVWRLQSYALARVDARELTGPPSGRFTFSPLGMDQPLFNRPQTETEISHLAEEVNVPTPLRRRPLFDELQARRSALSEGTTPHATWFGPGQPVCEIFFDGETEPLAPEQIIVCNLTDWDQPGWKPRESEGFTRPGGTPPTYETKAAIDPVTGRLAVLKDVDSPPTSVQVSWAYGLNGDLGSGPYDRRDWIEEEYQEGSVWQVGVSKNLSPEPGVVFESLVEALQAWNTQIQDAEAKPVGVIAILDNRTYDEDLGAVLPVLIPEGARLLLVAADWPETEVRNGLPGETERRPGSFEPRNPRPHIVGDLSVAGTAPPESKAPGEFVLNGLLVEGRLTVGAGHLGKLTLQHSTLVPSPSGARASLVLAPQSSEVAVYLDRCITGALTLGEAPARLGLKDSIITFAGETTGAPSTGVAIAGEEAQAEVEGSTVLGSTKVKVLSSSNSVFAQAVTVARRQTGCLRFSFVTLDSKTPRRFHCQPTLEIKERISAAEASGSALSDTERGTIAADVTGWLAPALTSMNYGDPAFAQLAKTCPRQIGAGADDGSEMGAFSFLKQPQRKANLTASLRDYLRFGMEAGIIEAT